MRAWSVPELGRPADVMRLTELPTPVPGHGQVAIRVAACALGFPDALMCRAGYQLRPTLPFTPGAEVVGEIVALGPHARPRDQNLAIGSRVIGIGVDLHGGLADVALVPDSLVLPAPQGLNIPASAAILGTYLTGWLALYHRAHLAPGETLLVQAAAGGVGSAAVQLGLARGATVIGVVRGEHKKKLVESMGAHLVIDREREDVITRVKEFAGTNSIHVGFDPVGGHAWTELTKTVASEGRLVVIGFAGGDIPTQPLNHVLVKNYTVIGVNSGHYVAARPAILDDAMSDLQSLIDSGHIEPVVGEFAPFEQASRALQDLDDGHSAGRYVIDLR